MRILHTLAVMFIGSFIIQYFFISTVMSNSVENITNSLGKIYLSIIMGLYMIVLEIMMHDHQYSVFSMKYYIIIGCLLGFFIYLYRVQKYITDKEYLKEMIEHHSMALLTSNKILEKTDDYNVSKLAKNIIQKQEDEIRDMKEILIKLQNK
jgi:Kef-type K+ transport system membrane component KefB